MLHQIIQQNICQFLLLLKCWKKMLHVNICYRESTWLIKGQRETHGEASFLVLLPIVFVSDEHMNSQQQNKDHVLCRWYYPFHWNPWENKMVWKEQIFLTFHNSTINFFILDPDFCLSSFPTSIWQISKFSFREILWKNSFNPPLSVSALFILAYSPQCLNHCYIALKRHHGQGNS